MNARIHNSTTIFSTTLKSLGLVIILFFLTLPVLAQNTKGDRPQSSGGGTKRENRFKIFKKKKTRTSKPPSYSRAQPRRSSRASTPRKESKAGKSIRMFPRESSRPSDKQRAWRGDISGRRIRTQDKESSGGKRNIYPQSGRYANRRPSERQRAGRGSAGGPPASTRSRTGKTSNVYPQRWQYSNNRSRTPQTKQRAVSNRATLARLNKLQGDPNGPRPKPKRKVVPRSASRSFIARRSTNIYASFPRPKRKQERAYEGDIAGRPLRTKNYETPRPGVISPGFKPYAGRKRVGDRPYRGPAAGSYRSATRTKPRAWTGDIAGRRLRSRNYTSKKRIEGRPTLSPGVRTATRSGQVQGKVAPRGPGISSSRLGRYQSQLRGRRTAKGGGSVSGKLWNNKQSAIPVRPPGAKSAGLYSSRMKGRRPLKGGGSVSGKLWNNKQSAIPVRPPGARSADLYSSSARMKGRRPLKGGGSVSGRIWNNRETPIPVRTPGARSQGLQRYTDGMSGKRPLKGGGSVSGRLWNNRETPIPVRTPGARSQGLQRYTDGMKGKRPVKGGGSISGKLWNNRETPIPVRTPPESARQVGGYPGKMKMFSVQPGFSDQGEEFTGTIRRPRFWKDYIRNPKANENAIKKKRPKSPTYAVDGYQIAVRTRKYVKNENAAEEATPKLKPTRSTLATGDLHIKMKQPAHGKKKNAPEDAIPGLTPSKQTVKASQYARGVRRTWDYIHNPSSAEEAMRVREPGKAFARSTDYQGNIKMQKFRLFEKNRALHPDAKFVKINKNNVDSERDLLTNFKLWWARLFKKEETQPDHLKDKGHKPRYDKGEKGLWYE